MTAKAALDKVVGFVSASVTPLIPGLVAGGMLKALLNVGGGRIAHCAVRPSLRKVFGQIHPGHFEIGLRRDVDDCNYIYIRSHDPRSVRRQGRRAGRSHLRIRLGAFQTDRDRIVGGLHVGACIGVGLRAKNKTLKGECFSLAFGCIVAGVTEPAIYGVNFRLKKPMFGVRAGSAAGGDGRGRDRDHRCSDRHILLGLRRKFDCRAGGGAGSEGGTGSRSRSSGCSTGQSIEHHGTQGVRDGRVTSASTPST